MIEAKATPTAPNNAITLPIGPVTAIQKALIIELVKSASIPKAFNPVLITTRASPSVDNAAVTPVIATNHFKNEAITGPTDELVSVRKLKNLVNTLTPASIVGASSAPIVFIKPKTEFLSNPKEELREAEAAANSLSRATPSLAAWLARLRESARIVPEVESLLNVPVTLVPPRPKASKLLFNSVTGTLLKPSENNRNTPTASFPNFSFSSSALKPVILINASSPAPPRPIALANSLNAVVTAVPASSAFNPTDFKAAPIPKISVLLAPYVASPPRRVAISKISLSVAAELLPNSTITSPKVLITPIPSRVELSNLAIEAAPSSPAIFVAVPSFA